MESIIRHWPAAEGLPAFCVRRVDDGNIEVTAGNYREQLRVANNVVVYARPELFPRVVKAAAFKALREAGHVS